MSSRIQGPSKALLYAIPKEQLYSFSYPHLSQESKTALAKQIAASQFSGKKGEIRWFYGFSEYPIVGVAGIGSSLESNSLSYASATSQLIKELQNHNAREIHVDFGWQDCPQETAEAATLSTYRFLDTKSPSKEPLQSLVFNGIQSFQERDWKKGIILANAQNVARKLSDTSANFMTPTLFASEAQKLLENKRNVTVNVFDSDWAKMKKMGAFLSVSQGSQEPCRFLELIFKNGPDETKWISLVGKGVTFDSGGISIKPSSGMALMKGDMAGAASVLASFSAAVQLNLPLNLVAVIPLTENMPSGSATKPGDVVFASNGKSIEVDNTDAEGRLILADALHYVCQTWKPASIIELSTLTGAMDVALGYPYAGVFTNSSPLWKDLNESAKKAKDLFWRMPLCSTYKSYLKSHVADLKNVGGRGGGACTAAIFLNEFVTPNLPFAHIDIAGVFHKQDSSSQDNLSHGMTGRPTRSIIEYLILQAEKKE